MESAGFFPTVESVRSSAKKAARKAAWDAEIAELRERKAARDAEAKKAPIDGEDGYLVGVIQSKGFSEVYADLTGKDAGEWVRSVMRVSDFHLKIYGMSRAQWILEKVADLAAKYYWGDPSHRLILANRIARSKDRQERRYLRVRLATPGWANPLKIAVIYRQRDRMTAETGIEHHVDHIVPLTHPRVCGLHCEANLRVITATENLQKKNIFHI